MDSRDPQSELPDHLSELPDELLQIEIGKALLSGQPKSLMHLDLYSFIQVSKFYYAKFYDTYHRASLPLKKLLDHAASAEWEDAENIWKVSPDLLTCYGTVYHPNRIYIEGQAPKDIPFEKNPGDYKHVNCTAWKIAIAHEEYEEAEAMGKEMTLEEKQKQFAELFPDGKIVKYNFDLEEAKRLLLALFEAVVKDELIDEKNLDSMNEETTRKLLYAVYAYAKPKTEHKTGLVFDANFYLEALKLYDKKCSQFGEKRDKDTFWCIRVEEWLAGCLGKGYLRAHSRGIGFDTPLPRRGCVLADGSSYLAFRRSSDSIPGYSFFVGYYGVGRRRGGGGQGAFECAARRALFETFSKLLSSKNESKDRLYAAICAPRNNIGSDPLK